MIKKYFALKQNYHLILCSTTFKSAPIYGFIDNMHFIFLPASQKRVEWTLTTLHQRIVNVYKHKSFHQLLSPSPSWYRAMCQKCVTVSFTKTDTRSNLSQATVGFSVKPAKPSLESEKENLSESCFLAQHPLKRPLRWLCR